MKRLRARNQNGYLLKTASGDYQANWNEYIFDVTTGKTKRRHRTEILGPVAKMRKADAEKELAKRVLPMNDSTTTIGDSRMTFRKFVENEYLPVMQDAWTEETKSSAKCDINYLLVPLGETALEAIDLAMLQKVMGHLAGARNLSESTVSRVRIRAKSILEYASEKEYIRRNPASSKYYRMPLCKPTIKEVLTKEQISKLWAAIKDTRDRLIIRIGSGCAVRETEVFGLVWECIHPGHIEIRSTGYRGKLNEYRVKRKASHRNVPIPRKLYDEFQKWRAESKSDSPLVFPSGRTGRPLWPGTWLQKRIQPLAKKAGITVQVNFRIMRRSFATANKNKLKDLQTVMGHSSIDMAGNVYAQGVEADAATMIQEFFDSIDAIAKSGKSRKRPPASLPTMKDAGKRMIQ